MKKHVFLLIILLIVQPVFANVIISEVLYNPINSETSGEAIVLYNNGNTAVDISGWTIATESSPKDATIPPNTTILPGRNLLIADNDFSLNKYDSSWPDPFHEEPITMSNTDAGVALKNNDVIIDAVGWGNPNNIDDGLYEDTPHSGAKEGESLQRVNYQDSDDNSADFMAGKPIFFREYNPLKIIIDLIINITNKEPTILNFEIMADDNASKSGVQIKPVSGGIKTFGVLVEVMDDDNSIENVKVLFKSKEFNLMKESNDGTVSVFKGNMTMKYYTAAGDYELVAVVNNIYGGEISTNIFFEYETLAAISSETRLSMAVAGGSTMTKTVTVKNLGNANVVLEVKGNMPTKDNSTIVLDNIEFSVDEFTTIQKLNSNYQTIPEVLTTGANSEMGIEFLVSASKELSSGSYYGEIIISAHI